MVLNSGDSAGIIGPEYFFTDGHGMIGSATGCEMLRVESGIWLRFAFPKHTPMPYSDGGISPHLVNGDTVSNEFVEHCFRVWAERWRPFMLTIPRWLFRAGV